MGWSPDPESAAKQYNIAATKEFGEDALLNILPGDTDDQASSAQNTLSLVPAAQGRGQERPPTDALLPDGNADWIVGLVPRPEVRLTLARLP